MARLFAMKDPASMSSPGLVRFPEGYFVGVEPPAAVWAW